MKLFLVSDRSGEVVGFRNGTDARWTASGKFAPAFGLPTLGVQFREMHENHQTFPLLEIELTDDQVKALKLSTKPLGPQYVKG